MYTCNWGCKNYSHYHCCACSLLFSRKIQLLKHLITCHPKPSEGQPHSQPAEGQPHSQPAEGPSHSFSAQPLDGPLNPVEATVRLDMAMLGVFNRVLNTFRELVKPFHPSIYINDSLAGDLKLNKDNLVYITVKDLP